MKKLLKAIIPPRLLKWLLEMRYQLSVIRYPKLTSHPEDDVLDCMIAYNEYGAYCIPSKLYRRRIIQCILKGKVYEPDTIQYMIDNCGTGDIIHAGAYFGDFLPALDRNIAGKILAFEPCWDSWRMAQMTIQLNGISAKTELFNIGLGSEVGALNLRTVNYKGEDLGGAKSLINEDDFLIGSETVAITTIDFTISEDRTVSIIQLDLEGHEIEALKGGIKTIKRCKPILILEDNHDYSADQWFRDNILDMGYAFERKVHNNYVYKWNQS
jgi:FkbM family methyltransferase